MRILPRPASRPAPLFRPAPGPQRSPRWALGPAPDTPPATRPWPGSGLGGPRPRRAVPAVRAVAAGGQPRCSGPTALGRAPRSFSGSAQAASGHPSPRPARTHRAPRAVSSTSALRGRTEAASSTAGCEADPGDEMTTPTLQVSRRGPAGSRRPKEARRGLRTGSRAGGGLLSPGAPPPPPPVSLFTRSEPRATSGPERPGPVAWPSPEAPACSRRPSSAVGLSLARASQAPPGKLGPAGRLLALPPPASLPTAPASSLVSDFLFSASDPSFIPSIVLGGAGVAPPGCMTDPSSRCCQSCWARKHKHAPPQTWV